MSELALKTISEEKKKVFLLTKLDLSHTGLTELPDELLELTTLKELDLSSTEIKNIEGIAALKNLTKLNLSYTSISDISPLRDLNELTELYLKETSTKSISSLFYSLEEGDKKGTENKNLDDNTFAIKIEGLDSNINDNNYYEIELKSSPKNIKESIFISNKKFKTNLKNLRKLDISLTSIRNIIFFECLENLIELNLSFTKINDVSSLAQLKQLKKLNCKDTPIKDLRPLSSMISRGATIAYDNYIWYKASSQAKIILIEGCPIQHPPKAILELGSAAITSYFRDINIQGTDVLSEAKLIIVGEPGAGKTTLMQKLLNPDYKIPQPENSTLGIQVQEGWRFYHPYTPESDFFVNIWDFGGQQIQYMTHQFFLTPGAVYILVSANDRKETMANFPYWFKIINLLGYDENGYSPICVVQNEINSKFVQEFDQNFYKKHYPELSISHYQINLRTDYSTFDDLSRHIKQLLSNLPHVNNERPASWRPIRSMLRQLSRNHNHINFSTFKKICSAHNVENEDSQLLFSSYLHRLGSLIHFIDDPMLKDFIILNPQWAVDAVYIVLSNTDIQKRGGKFSADDINSIWKKNYTVEERGKLLALMSKENFEICYELADQDGTYIAPQLLPDNRLYYSPNTPENLCFRFQYAFMPEGIITRLIVRMHDKISIKDDTNMIWRKGMLLEYKGCEALVLEEETRAGLKVIDITVTGIEDERKYLLKAIREEIEKIHHKWFRNIQVEQMVPCSCSYCSRVGCDDPNYFKFSTLKRYRERGRETIECDREILSVSVLSLLEGIYLKKEIQNYDKKMISSDSQPQLEKYDNTARSIHIHNHPLHQITQQQPQQATSEEPVSESQRKTFHREIISLVLVLLIGGLFWLWSGSLLVSSITGITLAAVFYWFTSKRRYMNMALIVLGIFSTGASPLVSGALGYTTKNLGVSIKWGDPMHLVLSLGLLMLAGFLFWLDHKQK